MAGFPVSRLSRRRVLQLVDLDGVAPPLGQPGAWSVSFRAIVAAKLRSPERGALLCGKSVTFL
jgi:hypothetical protein